MLLGRLSVPVKSVYQMKWWRLIGRLLTFFENRLDKRRPNQGVLFNCNADLTGTKQQEVYAIKADTETVLGTR